MSKTCADENAPLQDQPSQQLGGSVPVTPQTGIEFPLLGYWDTPATRGPRAAAALLQATGSSQLAQQQTVQLGHRILTPADIDAAPALGRVYVHMVAMIQGGVGNQSETVWVDVRDGTQISMNLASARVDVGYLTVPNRVQRDIVASACIAESSHAGTCVPTLSTELRTVPDGDEILIQIPPAAVGARLHINDVNRPAVTIRQIGGFDDLTSQALDVFPATDARAVNGFRLWSGAQSVGLSAVGSSPRAVLEFELCL